MKALVRDNIVIDIETRDINVYEYYHEDVAKLFVECPDDVKIGHIYQDGAFLSGDVTEEVE